MNKVYLHGKLGRTFGRRWDLAVNSAPEVLKAIDANCDGFIEYVTKQCLEGNEHYMLNKNPKKIKNKKQLENSLLTDQKLKDCEIHIVPAVYGGFIAKALIAIIGTSMTKGAAAAISGVIWGAVAQVAIGALQKSQSNEPQTSTNAPGVSTKSYLSEARSERASKEGVIPLGYGRLVVAPNSIGQTNETFRFGENKLLQSYSMSIVQHLISEGPIEGPVNEYGLATTDLDQALYLNDVQVKVGDAYNFVLNEQNYPSLISVGASSDSSVIFDKASYIYAYNQTLYGAAPYAGFQSKPIYYTQQDWLNKLRKVSNS